MAGHCVVSEPNKRDLQANHGARDDLYGRIMCLFFLGTETIGAWADDGLGLKTKSDRKVSVLLDVLELHGAEDTMRSAGRVP